MIGLVHFVSEYLLPDGEEALSDDEEHAINNILELDTAKRPNAKGN